MKVDQDSKITIWRYVKYGFGWYIAYVDSEGCFTVTSDFGNYGYRWRSIGKDNILEFLLDTEPQYIKSKLGQGQKTILDIDATRNGLRKTVCYQRRNKDLSKDQARRIYCNLASAESREEIIDALEHEPFFSEDFVWDYPPELNAFITEVWPLILDQIKEDLKTMTAPALPTSTQENKTVEVSDEVA